MDADTLVIAAVVCSTAAYLPYLLFWNPKMSHTVTIQTEVRDAAAVRAACLRLNLPQPVAGTHRLFAGQTATGLAVQLPGWKCPAVINTAAGTVSSDSYGGAWGNPQELDKFMQAYAVEKARVEARRKGHSVSEQTLADGSIKLTVHVGGWGG